MADQTDGTTVVLGVAVVGLIGFGIYVVVKGYLLADKLAPGDVPFSASDIPRTTNDPVQEAANPCRAIMQWDFHVRPTEQMGTENSVNYRRGTEVVILQAGSLRRNGARMYRVRVPRTSREGWVFIQPYEVTGDCRGASEEEIQRRVAARTGTPASPANSGAAPLDSPVRSSEG